MADDQTSFWKIREGIKMRTVEMVIIGGGPAGLSAAIRAYEQGLRDILIIERNDSLGGVLRQCIHNGFGLHIFKEELTGPEYAQRLINKVEEYNITCALETMVLDITPEKKVTMLSTAGVEEIQAGTVILAMGCREKPRGAISIPGDRCAGVFSAGTAQELVNMQGYNVGREAVILGSGDIGLIMARRLTYEGAKVKCVVELMPYSSGLKRNIVQCLDDYDIPLKYSSTVTRVVGKERLEGVYIAQVDENRNPIKETEEFVSCDALLLSVGLVPENELSKNANVELSNITGGAVVDSQMQTSVPGIFSCGNVLHIHDLVDNVTLEAYETADNAVAYLKGGTLEKNEIPVVPDKGVRYIVPQYINKLDTTESLDLKFRSSDVYKFTSVSILADGEVIKTSKKRIITPGEMEKVTLKGALLDTVRNAKQVSIKIGDE